MTDIICTRCGESWNAILDSLDQEEKEQLLAGQWCPDCVDKDDEELEHD